MLRITESTDDGMVLRGNSLDIIGVIMALCVDVASHSSVCPTQTNPN